MFEYIATADNTVSAADAAQQAVYAGLQLDILRVAILWITIHALCLVVRHWIIFQQYRRPSR